jgi:hypothetical protein
VSSGARALGGRSLRAAVVLIAHARAMATLLELVEEGAHFASVDQ